MFEVKREKNEILVTVKLTKRLRHRDPKIFVYVNDALQKAKESYPELKISQIADHNQVASTVKSPHEVTWRFKVIEKEEKELKNIKKMSKKQQREALDELVNLSQEMGGYDKELVTDLTSHEERAILEETTEKVQEPTE